MQSPAFGSLRKLRFVCCRPTSNVMRGASRRESCCAGTACSPGELLAATTAGMVLTPAACSDRSDRDQVSAPPIYLPLRQRRPLKCCLPRRSPTDRRRRAAHDVLHRLLREELHCFVVIGAEGAASRHRLRVMISVLLRPTWTCCCFRKGSSAIRDGLGRSATASPALQRCDGRSFPKVRSDAGAEEAGGSRSGSLVVPPHPLFTTYP